MVFYLKYRPKKISELDSLDLRERLETVLKGKLPDDIHHAFLFTGSRGLGKTSTARILAKAINCTNRKKNEIEPCNNCISCKAINDGNSLDVLEIDGASNRGIDEIRDLREKIKLAPFSSKKKIYIIDEVHMLTAEAFNALLKTLEEPPTHAYFFLCTTEPGKIPETIASRCFQIKFPKATNNDLISSFNRIAKGEKIKADKEALLEIAKLSDGSFRDGAKILEELSSHSTNITTGLIEKKYKTQTMNGQIEGLVTAFAQKDAKAAIEIVNSLSSEGADFKLFVQNLIKTLHESLLSQINGEKFELTLSETKDLIEKLAGAHMSIKYAVLPQLPLELTIVEWCSSKNPALPAGSSESPAGQSVSVPDVQNSNNNNQQTKTLSNGKPKDDKILGELIDSLKSENFSIAGVLRGCRVDKYNGKQLVLSTNFKFHKERLSDRNVLDMLEKNLKQITGIKTKVVIL